MKETILINYFKGLASAEVLQKDLDGSIIRSSVDVREIKIEDSKEEFVVKKHHLLKLCDDILAGKILPQSCEIIGFCIIASEAISWPDDEEGNICDEVIHLWAAPEINYPLNLSNIKKFKILLETSKDTFTRNDLKK